MMSFGRITKGLFSLLALALLLTPATLSRAQESPDAKPEKEEADAFTSTVKMRFEGLMFVDATVNGKGPYNFLFDSGASMTILGEKLAEELAITLYDSPMPAQGVSTQEMKMAIAENVKVGEFSRDDLLVGVMNLDHISGELGKHMHGIVGQNMIKYMKKIHVDFSKSEMSLTRYKKGEGPQMDLQETMLKMMLKRGGKLPGMPGQDEKKEPRKDPKKDPKKEDDGKEEGFSVKPFSGEPAWLGDDKKTESRRKLEAMQFKYDHFKAMGGLVDVALWFMEAEVNGKKHTMFFDTGASTLCVLDKAAADALRLTPSYSYPVKGVGEAEASESVLETIKISNLTIHEPSCSIMDLGGVLAQLKQLGNDCAGIIGIPVATRYKSMTVDGESKLVKLEPYSDGETNEVDPAEQEEQQRKAAIRTWQGKAAKVEFKGESIKLDDWEALGLKDGGMKVTSVSGGAEKAGLKEGDIITAIVGEGEPDEKGVKGDAKVRGFGQFVVWACLQDPGSEFTLKVKRGKEVLSVKITLVAYGWQGTAPEKYRSK